jgi:hypothetical protein
MTVRGQILGGFVAGIALVLGLMIANAAVEWLSHSDAVGLILLAGVLTGCVLTIVWCALHLNDPR